MLKSLLVKGLGVFGQKPCQYRVLEECTVFFFSPHASIIIFHNYCTRPQGIQLEDLANPKIVFQTCRSSKFQKSFSKLADLQNSGNRFPNMQIFKIQEIVFQTCNSPNLSIPNYLVFSSRNTGQ
jgi:hypothetical protein